MRKMYIPSVEYKDVHNGGAEGSKPDPIRHGEEGAEMKRALTLISRTIKVEIGVYDARDVVYLAGASE